jgi:hypothetical protein
MKRLLQAVGVLSFCIFLAGCGGDSHEGLISDTIAMMNQAATETDNIQKRITEAVKKVEDGKSNKLDLTDAMKAADKLKETGDNTLQTKARIEMVKLKISDEEKETNAKNKEEELNTAFKNLFAKQAALDKAFADAEKLDVANAKDAVQKLRERYLIAKSPFEGLTR